MTGFLGEFEATLDAKGRFLLPAGFKKQLPEGEDSRFVINRGFEKCLALYPVKNWEPLFADISKLNDFDPPLALAVTTAVVSALTCAAGT